MLLAGGQAFVIPYTASTVAFLCVCQKCAKSAGVSESVCFGQAETRVAAGCSWTYRRNTSLDPVSFDAVRRSRNARVQARCLLYVVSKDGPL